MDTQPVVKIETEADETKAYERFEQIKYARKGDADYAEKMALATALGEYGKKAYPLGELSDDEFNQIMKDEYGHTA